MSGATAGLSSSALPTILTAGQASSGTQIVSATRNKVAQFRVTALARVSRIRGRSTTTCQEDRHSCLSRVAQDKRGQTRMSVLLLQEMPAGQPRREAAGAMPTLVVGMRPVQASRLLRKSRYRRQAGRLRHKASDEPQNLSQSLLPDNQQLITDNQPLPPYPNYTHNHRNIPPTTANSP
jgi:hypothetical protein